MNNQTETLGARLVSYLVVEDYKTMKKTRHELVRLFKDDRDRLTKAFWEGVEKMEEKENDSK